MIGAALRLLGEGVGMGRLVPLAAAVALLTVMGLPLLASPSASGATGPSVSANSLVDLDHGLAFPQDKQNEPSITRDPLTGVLVAGANDELSQPLCLGTSTPLASPCPFAPGAPTSAYYYSTDNGQSWAGGYLPGFGTLLADPVNEFAGEQVTVSRSYDDGRTWADPVYATNTDNKSNFDDHEWVAVDNSPGSAHFGRVYVNWAVFCNTCAGNGNVKLYVAHSDDEGRTWSAAVQVSAVANNAAQGFRETGQMTVSSAGTVEVFWTENADSKKLPSLQVVAVSTDGGQTFSAPVTIAQAHDYPLTGTPFDVVDLFNRVPGMSARVDCFPHPAADPSSARVYVVWCDFRSGHGTVQGAVSSDGAHWRLVHRPAPGQRGLVQPRWLQLQQPAGAVHRRLHRNRRRATAGLSGVDRLPRRHRVRSGRHLPVPGLRRRKAGRAQPGSGLCYQLREHRHHGRRNHLLNSAYRRQARACQVGVRLGHRLPQSGEL